MKKISILAILNLLFLFVHADEGMWLLSDINKKAQTMISLGLEISPNEIYDTANNSIKDAVVNFGGYCTGEIISDKGLLLTNHHCGYYSIQELSSKDTNYLKNGFFAKSVEDEINCPGLFVTFLEDVKDVTERFISELNDTLSEAERNDVIFGIKETIISEIKDSTVHAEVNSFFEGNKFLLFTYKTYTDIRLVAAPPESIGKFGGDKDNWMWPRHTGDFSFFRVYADSNNQPADFNTNNVPLKPKRYLPISTKGVKENDFAMILGYPGSTQRFATASEVNDILKEEHPNRINVRTVRQDILTEAMENDSVIKVKYASKYANSSNYWKYSIGQSEWLRRLNIADQKLEKEKELKEKFLNNQSLGAKYANAIDSINYAISKKQEFFHVYQYLYESFRRGSELIYFATEVTPLIDLLENKGADDDETTDYIKALKDLYINFLNDYDLTLDIDVSAKMLEIYKENISAQYYPEFYKTLEKKYKNNYKSFVEDNYKSSMLSDEEKFISFLESPNLKKLKNDPLIIFAQDFIVIWNDMRNKMAPYDEMISKYKRTLVEGILKLYPDSLFYPNANFTMRLTYGTVNGYTPKDAVYFDYYTTTNGILEKYIPDDYEFDVPKKLIQLIKDTSVVTCFITNNDITGGNSGSPVINSKGELLGTAFDGNWESMSGDICYVQDKQRCIVADIRYIIFIVKDFGGSYYLIDELGLN